MVLIFSVLYVISLFTIKITKRARKLSLKRELVLELADNYIKYFSNLYEALRKLNRILLKIYKF